MSTQKLTELPNILYDGIDYDNTIAEMRKIIEDNPNWSENWTGFYNSEAGTMLTQLMAWISDNLGVKQNVVYNEMFIGTAQKTENKIRHLQQIGYIPVMAKSAKGKLEITVNSLSETDIILTPKRDVGEGIEERPIKVFSFQGKDVNGDEKNYEILQYKDDKPDYMAEVALPAGETETTADINGNGIYAREGKTVYEEFYSDVSDGPVFELANANIDDGSIRVYDLDDNNIEFNKVSSFLSIEAKDENYPVPYVVEFTTNSTFRIRFPSAGIMTYGGQVNTERMFKPGHTIGVLYRTTNGSIGNSPIGFLKTTTTVSERNGNSIQININNTEACTGGSNAETIEDAVINAPLSLRTMDRAVTPEDFNYLLGKNTNILKIKAYSPSNQPSGFKQYFGRNINPQEAFAFVALNKNYEGVPTSEYKNFPWITLNKENVLNEKYCFDGGIFNEPTEYSRMYNKYKVTLPSGNSVTYENARVIKMSNDFCSQMKSDDIKGIVLRLSIAENEEDFFANIPFSLEFDEEDGNSNLFSSIRPTDDNYVENYIVRKIATKSAEYITSKTFGENEVFNCTNKSIKIYLDEKTGVIINLYDEPNKECYRLLNNIKTYKEGDNELSKALNNDGIVQIINKKFAQLYTTQEEFAMYDSEHSLQYLGLNITSAGAANNTEGYFSGKNVSVKINGKIYKILLADYSNMPHNYIMYPDSKYARPDRYYVEKDKANEYNTSLVKGDSIGGELYNEFYEPNYYMYVEKSDFGNYNETSLNDLAYRLTYSLASCNDSNGLVIKYNEDLIEETLDSDDIELLRSLRVSVTSRFSFDENNSSYAIFGNDLAFETVNGSSLIDNAIVIEDVEDTGVTDMTSLYAFFNIISLPPVQKAADYSNIATVIQLDNGNNNEETTVETEKRYRLSIKSPLKGKSSSLYFENLGASDILATDFGYNYIGNTSDKAIGLRIIDLYLEDAIASSYEEDIVAEDIPLTGYLVLQDNTIDSASRYDTIYANYKLSSIDNLELGSVYNNYYLTGDEEIDAENKPKIVGLEGQYMQEYIEEGRTKYQLIESKSDFDIRFTKKQVNTNSLYSIETDLDVIKADLIKIPTTQITKEEGYTEIPEYLIFSVDDYPEMRINLKQRFSFVEELNANGLYELIYSAITNTGGENVNLNLSDDATAITENVYNVINKAYRYLNQLEFGNFTKASYSKITFYSNYDSITKNEIALYKKIFGTTETNTELYNLYGDITDDYLTDEGCFCPKPDDPIVFTYKKRVFKEDEGIYEIRDPDYYIEISTVKNEAGLNQYSFYLKKTPESKFPDTPFYIHFINDRSCLLDDNYNKVEYDEDILQQYMRNYKITGTDIYFLKPYFRTYDIAATIHYNSNFNLSDIREEINRKIDENFGLTSADIAKPVSKSKIIKTIMNCVGVESVNVTYFGYDYTLQNDSPNQTYQIDAKFYEILFLHEDEVGEHGKIFNYVQYSD